MRAKRVSGRVSDMMGLPVGRGESQPGILPSARAGPGAVVDPRWRGPDGEGRGVPAARWWAGGTGFGRPCPAARLAARSGAPGCRFDAALGSLASNRAGSAWPLA
ncbi:hypothetical protein BGLA2_340011 [Burkholderia gladioli]|nr:hypothetical protein BGLA2_340011 [Burkholderia gladioli]